LSLKSPEIYFKASCGLDISALLHYGLPPCPKAPVTPFNFEKLFQFELNQAIGYNPLSSMADDIDIVVEAPGIPLSFSRYFSSSLKNRHQDSPLGKGWTHSWQTHLEEDENGNVTIFDLNSSLKYQPDSRGGYFSPKGDYSKLSKADGLFTLKYSDGTIEKFTADGKLDYIEDLNGNRITAEYTEDLLTRLSHNAGQFLQLSYNGTHIETITDHTGTLSVSFSYNAEQLASVTDIFGRSTHYTYFGSGASKQALQTVQYPDNTHEDFSYDANGRLAQIAYNNEPLISFSYDSAGTVTVTSNGSVQTFFYGASGELMKYKDPLGNISSSEFNSDYQITKIIRPDGLSTSIGYDRAGNANSLKDALGQITAFDYGDFDRMTAMTDAKVHTSDYSYDEKGNLESITYPDSTQEHYLYDAKGNISQSTNRRGTPISYSYDANGLVLRKEYADGTSVAYTYNAIGDLTSVTDQTGITSFTYDSNHGLKRITYPGGRFLEFSYDSAGRRISSVDQLGYTLNYAYDDKGLLSSIQGLVRYSYDEKQRLVRKELGNGVYTTYKYDLADNLIQLINYSSENAILSRFDYSYNSLGNRISMSTLDGDWTYTYDVTGQLTKAQFVSSNASIPNKSISYVYDAVGNRVQEIEDSVTTDYSTNEMNQYDQVGNTTYAYDEDGNLISKTKGSDTWTYSYNDENKLVSTTGPDGMTEYQYDGLGNLSATTKNGVTTHYMLDPTGFGNVVGEYDEAGNLVTRYNHGFGLLSSNDHFYTFDGNGNTVGLTNAASVKVNAYVYEPFGQTLLRSETVENDFEFVGQFGVMQAGDDLVFMRNRFYVAGLGRFLNEDPIGLNGEDVNLYRYVGNDAVNWVDIDGLSKGGNPFNNPSGVVLELLEALNNFGRNSPQHREAIKNVEVEIKNAKGKHKKHLKAVLKVGKSPRKYANKRGVLKNVKKFGKSKSGMVPLRIAFRVGGAFTGVGTVVVVGLTIYDIYENWDLIEKFLRKWYDLPPEWWKKLLRGSLGDTGTASSVDPNELTGPKGYGDKNYIQPDQILAYRIDFENDKEATAPAQQVDITNQLEEKLDWSTFQLTEIGFGDKFVSVPAENGQAFDTRVPMTYKNVDFEVHIKAGIDQGTGEVYAHFYTYQPGTELPPTVDIGFLPPEDDTGRGMGFVNYTINHKKGLADNTEIRNIAKIVFDMGEVIYTNQIDPHDPSQGTDPEKEALVTLDTMVPQSTVQTLPAESPETLTLRWNGEDSGSGIAYYNIYMRDGQNGEWQHWLEKTTETHAKFNGEMGHTYQFYSMAIDNVGHQEQKQPLAEAQTTITDKQQACPTTGSINATCDRKNPN
jgi:RHS repeat-associated protein